MSYTDFSEIDRLHSEWSRMEKTARLGWLSGEKARLTGLTNQFSLYIYAKGGVMNDSERAYARKLLDMINSVEELVNDPLDDDVYCLDIEGSSRRRPSDDQIWMKIKDKTGVTNSTSFQQLDESKREEIFLELKDCGASLRQLERLTGIGQLLEQRVQC